MIYQTDRRTKRRKQIGTESNTKRRGSIQWTYERKQTNRQTNKQNGRDKRMDKKKQEQPNKQVDGHKKQDTLRPIEYVTKHGRRTTQ